MKTNNIDFYMFFPALFIFIAVCIPLILNPDAGMESVNFLLGLLTGKLGWMFSIFGLGSFFFLLWLAFGRYGNVKLGSPQDAPEFSKVSWIGMLFTAGVGTGLVYWSIIEPIYYLQQPPFGIEPGSKEAAEWAAAYGAYHWGFIAWAVYCVPAVPLAYAYHVRKSPSLRMSSIFRGRWGKQADKWPGKIIDIFVLFGMLGAAGTMFGLGAPMLTSTVAHLFGLEDTFTLKMIIILLWTGLISASAFRGLKKGIRLLSDMNLYLALFLVLFVLVVGPTMFIFGTFTNSVGLVLQNFVRMSLWTDPIQQGGWPQGWTMFFWAWWIASAPFLAMFITQISKGRTIREVILANLVWGTLGCWVYFAVFGVNSIHIELHGTTSMTELMAATTPENAIATILGTLPGQPVTLLLFALLMLIFLATTADSVAYVISSMTVKKLAPGEEPKRWYRLFWVFFLIAIAITIMVLGGMKPIQASSTLGAFPLLFIIVWAVICFLKDIEEDIGHETKPKVITIEHADSSRMAPEIPVQATEKTSYHSS